MTGMSTTEGASFTLEELLAQRSWARRLARRLVATPADAEDLVQDGLLAGLVARPADRGGLRPWLATVLGRAAAKRRRSDRRREARELEQGAALAAAAVPSPEAMVARFEGQRLLTELVLALEPRVREVVLLRFCEDLTSVEIARALGTPEGTVRWRLKRGLDELRERLDQRHGGRREAWLGLLVPIAGDARDHGEEPAEEARGSGGGGARGAAWWLALAGGAAVVIAAFWMAVGRQAAPGGARVEPAAPGGRPPATRRVPQLAAVADPDECRRRVLALRAEAAAREPDFMRAARTQAPEVLYDFGSPNPAAEAALAPLLSRVLDASADRPAGHTLGCRSLMCRLDVLVAATALSYDWETAIRQDPELRERTNGFRKLSGPPLTDPLTGASQRQEVVHLGLWALDAAPTMTRLRTEGPAAMPPPVTLIPAGPVPADLARCREELAATERRLHAMTAVIERDASPSRQWARSPANPALTIEMEALARAILALPPASRAIVVACRSDVCRVDFDRQAFPGPNDWKKLFTPAWRKRMGHAEVGGWTSHFVIEPADATRGREVLTRIQAQLLEARGLRACEDRHAPDGRLDLELTIPRTGAAAPDGEGNRIGWRTAGPLWATPFARCLETELTSIVARAALPAKVTGATVQRGIEFPRLPAR
jgi:RNA polymerase sigma factor (sigma-70 family)